jgi:hydroxymethylpyrimidine pyrophosphatase-like HAD family hydrolase
MNTIIIFDLDDTLVNSKMKIPRQTYHMLNKFKKLNYIIGIITYNWMVGIVAKETNLYKYTNHIFYDYIDRYILFEKCVSQIMNDHQLVNENVNKIYYIDDRLDNLQAISEKNENVITHHCYNMYELYKLKNLL